MLNFEGLSSKVENLVKIVVLLAVVGFFALRARYLYLGVPWDAALALSVDRYLVELWHLLVFFISEGFLVIVTALFSLLLLDKLSGWVVSRFATNESGQRVLGSFGPLPAWASIANTIALAAIGIGVWGGSLLLLDLATLQGIAVGHLADKPIRLIDESAFEIGLLAAVGAVFTLLRYSLNKATKRSLVGMLSGLVIVLVSAHGYSGHRADYACVVASAKGQMPELSLLLDHNSDRFHLWVVNEQKLAGIRLIPRKELDRMWIGEPVNIVELAKTCSSGSKKGDTTCHLFATSKTPKACADIAAQLR